MVVLDDTIMHDEEPHITRKMRVRIFLRHSTVCRPASMSNTSNIGALCSSVFLDFCCEIGDAPDCFLEEYIFVRGYSEDSGRVISTIFEISKSFDEEWERVFLSIIGKNSAHRR